MLYSIILPRYPALVIYLICSKIKIKNKLAGFAKGYNKITNKIHPTSYIYILYGRVAKGFITNKIANKITNILVLHSINLPRLPALVIYL